jgi:hypothetical protein
VESSTTLVYPWQPSTTLTSLKECFNISTSLNFNILLKTDCKLLLQVFYPQLQCGSHFCRL